MSIGKNTAESRSHDHVSDTADYYARSAQPFLDQGRKTSDEIIAVQTVAEVPVMNTLEENAAHFREARRKAWWIGFVVGASAMLLALTLAGCATVAPTHVVTEIEHVSHPTTGWPVTKDAEDGISQAHVLLRWKSDGWYFDAGAGVNLQGRDGGGFGGPVITGTLRGGKEWELR